MKATVHDLAIARGLISGDDLSEAQCVRQRSAGSLDAALVRLGAIAEKDLLSLASEVSDIPLIAPERMPSLAQCRDAIERLRVPVSWLRERQAAIWFEDGDGEERLCVLTAAVPGPELYEAAEQWHPRPACFFLGGAQLIDRLLGDTDASSAGAADVEALHRELAEQAPAIDFVNAVLADAVLSGASDVHIEPLERNMVVRLRIDGVLSEWKAAPRALLDAVGARVKLQSGMDIAERRLPQDGRQRIRVCGRELDVRVSSLPTRWGESVVLRLIGTAESLPTLPALGLGGEDAQTLLALMANPHGIVLVSGPTGSGKTTTVYRLLSHLNDGSRKILTIEDPVEMDLPGVQQMAVRSDIGLSFAAGLRSILRQDPDVILVGEIRDAETAAIAVQAALTGHLVISTVHTNSAVAAITRLLDLGIEPFLLVETVRGIVGQRLLRTLCQACGGSADLVATCRHCNGTGYRGRTGAFEIMIVDDLLRRAIRDRPSEATLVELARGRGYRTMIEDARRKVEARVTDERELVRVLDPRFMGAAQ